jgi:membrane dipeptidase
MKEFVKEWAKDNPPTFATVKDVANHIDRVVKFAGVDHVGFGSDFDGVGDSLPVGLKDVSQYPNLIRELLARGYSEADIEKMASGNVLRVWEAVEAFAKTAE